MDNFVKLSCPSCGSTLKVTSDVDRFACAHCGSEWIVKRGGGIVSLAPVTEGLKKVQTGVDKTAAELAIRRLREDLQEVNNQVGSVNMRAYNLEWEMTQIKMKEREMNLTMQWLVIIETALVGSSVFSLIWTIPQMQKLIFPLIFGGVIFLILCLISSWIILRFQYGRHGPRIIQIKKEKATIDADMSHLNHKKAQIEQEIAKHKRIVEQ
jgi:DNA-directed RNA polymerase subunit RPC12/RpoP